MKAFQLAALLLSSRVLGAPTGHQGSDVVSAQNPVGSDSVTPTDDAVSGDQADPNLTPPEGDSTGNDPTENEEVEDPETTVAPSTGVEPGSEDDAGNTPTQDDEVVSGYSGEDSGNSTGGDVDIEDTGGDTSGGGESKGFRSVLYFMNWGIYHANTQPKDIPVDKVTHLLYAFADISETGEVISSDAFADVEKRLDGSAPGSEGGYTPPENTNEGVDNDSNTPGSDGAYTGPENTDGDTGDVGSNSSEDGSVDPSSTGAVEPTDTATAGTEGTNGDAVDPGTDSGSTGGTPDDTDGTPEGTEDTSAVVGKRAYTGASEEYTGAENTAGDNTSPVDTTGDSTGAVDTATGGVAYGLVGEIFRLKKENRHLKVLLSIGGWTYSQKFAPVAASETMRKAFAESAVKLMTDYGFDGLDIDWEYPKDQTEAQNFVLLLKECRAKLDEYSTTHGGYHFELTVATSAGEEKYSILDMEAMDPLLDAWHLMAYDYAGSWDETSGHQAALYPSENPEATKFNTNDAVEGYIGRGIASQKITVGIPLYGRSFMNTDGMGMPFSGQGDGSFEQGVWLYKDLPRGGATEEYDETAYASYSYDSSERELVTYDTVRSVTEKAKWMVQKNLGGAVFWEASGDKKDEKQSLVCAVVGAVGPLDKTENLLDYPNSSYSNIKGGGSGGAPSYSEGEGSYEGAEDGPGGNTAGDIPDSSRTPPDTSGTPSDTPTEGNDQSGNVGGGQSGEDLSNVAGDEVSGDIEEIPIPSSGADNSGTPPPTYTEVNGQPGDVGGEQSGDVGSNDQLGDDSSSAGIDDVSGDIEETSTPSPDADTSGTPPPTSTEGDEQSGDVGGGQFVGDSSNVEGDDVSGNIEETPDSSSTPDTDATEPSSGPEDTETGSGNVDGEIVSGDQSGSEGGETSESFVGDDVSNSSGSGSSDSVEGGDTSGGSEGDDASSGFETSPTPSSEDEPCSCSDDAAQSGQGDSNIVDEDQAGSEVDDSSNGLEETPSSSPSTDATQPTCSEEAQVDWDDGETDTGTGEQPGDEEDDQSGEDSGVYVEGNDDADTGDDEISSNTELTPTPNTGGEQSDGDAEQLDEEEANTGDEEQTGDDGGDQYVEGDASSPASEDSAGSTEGTSDPSATPGTEDSDTSGGAYDSVE